MESTSTKTYQGTVVCRESATHPLITIPILPHGVECPTHFVCSIFKATPPESLSALEVIRLRKDEKSRLEVVIDRLEKAGLQKAGVIRVGCLSIDTAVRTSRG